MIVKALLLIIASLFFLALLCLASGWFSVIPVEIAGIYAILLGFLDIFIVGLTLLFFTNQINNLSHEGYTQFRRKMTKYLGMEGHWFIDPSRQIRFYYWVLKTLGVIVTISSAYALYRFFVWMSSN